MQERQGGLRVPTAGGWKHGVLSHLLLKPSYIKKKKIHSYCKTNLKEY